MLKERLEAIERYGSTNDKSNGFRRTSEDEKKQKLIGQIRKLEKRINALLKVANACKDNGIQLIPDGYFKYKYEDGNFLADSVTHKVGFFITRSIADDIEYVGIRGEFGEQYEFYTNGASVFVDDHVYYPCGRAIQDVMEDFLHGFDRFEEAFYEYVDGIVFQGGK